MNIIYMLLTISVIVALAFFIAFVLSVKKGQYEDTYTPSVRMLFDDDVTAPTIKNQIKKQPKKNPGNSK